MSDTRTDHRKSYVTYETEEQVRAALIEVCVFLFFVCVTTFIAISLQTIYSFYFNRTLERLFSQRSMKQMGFEATFEDITTIEEFWSFLKTFFESLNKTWALAGNDEMFQRGIKSRILAEQRKMLFLEQNLVLEAPRLRQIRIKPKPCFSHKVFENLYKDCYGPYKRENEDRRPEFKNTRYFSLANNSVMPLWGNLEVYYGAGYVSFLTYDQTLNENTMNDLIDHFWIDRASRLIMIEMVAYNNNMDLFNNMKFIAEIMPCGGIVTYSYMEVAPLFTVWSTAKPIMLTANVIFYAFIIFNTGNEIFEIYRYGLYQYLRSVWNYIDWGILLMAYFALVLSFLHGFFIQEYLDDVFEYRYNKLSSLDKTCHWFSIYVASMACVAFLVWIRIFRFISFNKTMLAFYLALKQSARDILGFAMILFMIYMIFAILGLAVFGTSNLDFSTFKYAYFFMMRLMLHDFEYTNFERSDPIWGQLYFMAFIVVIVFLLFNMFLAIISSTYINVKKDALDNPSAIREVFIKIWNEIINCCRTINDRLSAKPRAEISPHSYSLDDNDSKAIEERRRKIQFQDSITSDDEETANERTTTPRPIKEDEALKEYYGIGRASPTSSTSPLQRSVSDYSASLFETPDESINEPPYDSSTSSMDKPQSFDFLHGLRDRVKKVEEKLATLSEGIELINSKLVKEEKKAKKSQQID